MEEKHLSSSFSNYFTEAQNSLNPGGFVTIPLVYDPNSSPVHTKVVLNFVRNEEGYFVRSVVPRAEDGMPSLVYFAREVIEKLGLPENTPIYEDAFSLGPFSAAQADIILRLGDAIARKNHFAELAQSAVIELEAEFAPPPPTAEIVQLAALARSKVAKPETEPKPLAPTTKILEFPSGGRLDR